MKISSTLTNKPTRPHSLKNVRMRQKKKILSYEKKRKLEKLEGNSCYSAATTFFLMLDKAVPCTCQKDDKEKGVL